ncbi:glycosyltransferase [Algoriphagus lacus]|uniref:Glycosyltransferase n=1 Tax=Algoriphagus lacus TaxID=2056311 RepID=A0A418PNH6_9BACT|nr:glycosyltransferase family 4 protein [Algoriphagus lacus]RIW13095.1 glycosyltransferase [Algoriphagus lacus]
MKIFQVIQKPQARGVELFTSLLSEELVNQGHEVILISIFEGEFVLPFTGRQIHLNRPLKNRLWDWKAWKSFADLVKKESPDIIQANAGDTLKFTVLSRLFFGWKVPVIFRNASLISSYISHFWIKQYNEFLLNQVEGIVSVSQTAQEDMRSFFKLNKPELLVIPIGVETRLQSMCSPKEGKRELVHIGGFTFEKNHGELLDIFQRLSDKDPSFRLILIGEGPLWNQVKAEVKARNLENQVEFFGNVGQPFSHISKNAILLLPSTIEGLPGVILEAMLHQIPVIAYGVGGIPEVLRNGETGWCVPPQNTNAFVKAIQEVLTMDNEQKMVILKQAYQMVSTNYSLSQISLLFEQFYRSLLSTNK